MLAAPESFGIQFVASPLRPCIQLSPETSVGAYGHCLSVCRIGHWVKASSKSMCLLSQRAPLGLPENLWASGGRAAGRLRGLLGHLEAAFKP
eukprot:9503956-Pyramimonas_sp.AAC.3